MAMAMQKQTVSTPTEAKAETKKSPSLALRIDQHQCQYQKTTHEAMARRAPLLEADALAVGDKDNAGVGLHAQVASACSARDVATPAVRSMDLPLPLHTSAARGTRIIDGISFNGGLGTLALKSGHRVQTQALTGAEKEARSMAAIESATIQRYLFPLEVDSLTVNRGNVDSGAWLRAQMALKALKAEALAISNKKEDAGAWPHPQMKVVCNVRRNFALPAMRPMALPLPLPTSAATSTRNVDGTNFKGDLGTRALNSHHSVQEQVLTDAEKRERPMAAHESATIQRYLRTSASLTPPSARDYAMSSGARAAELHPTYQKHIMSASLPPSPGKVAPRGVPVAGQQRAYSTLLQTLPPKRPAPSEEGGRTAWTKRPRWARLDAGGCQKAQSGGLFKTHGDRQVRIRDSGSDANKVPGSVSARSLCGKSGDSTYKIKGFARRVHCSREGCLKYAQRAGLCISHGEPTKRCSVEGCSNAAQVRGVCRKHGPNLKICTRAGCTNQAIKHGVCMKHGAKVRVCSREGCTTYAQRGGLCTKHGTKRRRCNWDGCTNQAVRGGVCIRHGAKRRPCMVEGCPNYAQSAGVCVRHGARKKCSAIRPVENEVAASLLQFSEQDATNSGA